MSNCRRKILLVSHDATRTGAPILLLNLADVLLRNGYAVEFILKFSGPLELDFKNKGKTFIAHHNPINFKERIQRKLNIFPYFFLQDIDFNSYDFLISNTITNGDILSDIRKLYVGPIVSYIHELKMATNKFTTKERLDCLIKSTDLYVVPSEAVRNFLVDDLGVIPGIVLNLNYYIPIKDNNKEALSNQREFTVGGLGVTEWRKGSDLFIQTANILQKKSPDKQIKFIWQGGSFDNLVMERINYDIEKACLTHRVKFIESSSNVESFYNSINIFLLTSREDPFPLVVLEAANHKIPTICFDGAGGACEFVNACSGGAVVPYLDLNVVVERILGYNNNSEDLLEAGERANKYMRTYYQDESIVLNQFECIIRKVT